MMKKNILLAASATVLALASCTNDENTTADNSQPAGNAVGFSTYMCSTTVYSRGTVVTQSDVDGTTTSAKGFGVFAFYEPKNIGDYNSYKYSQPDFMNNQQVKKSATSKKWEYSPVKYWPNNADDKLTFFAYAPYDEKMTWTALGIQTSVTGKKMNMSCLIDPYVTDQVDYFIADPVMNINKVSTVNATTGLADSVKFEFKHITAQVNVLVGVEKDSPTTATGTHEPGTWDEDSTTIVIKSVEFKDLYNTLSNTYDISAGTNTGWKSGGDLQDITLTSDNFAAKADTINKANYGSTSATASAGKYTRLNNDESVMFLAPQKLGKVIVTYFWKTKDKNLPDKYVSTPQEVECDLSSIVMSASKVYNINLLIGMMTVKFSVDVEEWPAGSPTIVPVNPDI